MGQKKNTWFDKPISRRKFFELGTVTAGIVTAGAFLPQNFFSLGNSFVSAEDMVKIFPTSGGHNCGGRCSFNVHVRDGRVVRVTGDESVPDTKEVPQLRPCLRCRAYRDRLYHPDRLKYPMKRVGKRGEGKFERITWEEAIDTIAANTKRIMQNHGPEAIYLNYATGNQGRAAERNFLGRLMGLYGGYLGYYGSYSTACTSAATPYTYGTASTGNSREDWVNSKLIILSACNPGETIHGTNTAYYLRLAKDAGAKIISIDPMYSNTTMGLADEWIPIRPTTDSALFDAMAYVMISENLHDQKFLDTYCMGFDEEHMPAGIPAGNSYKSYILGQSDDKTPKTPLWAESITGVPKETILRLAREYATVRPGVLLQGWGSQRHANGEQTVRSATVLAAMTGNVGVKGGWASGQGSLARSPRISSIPIKNPCKARISVFSWPDAIVSGKGMGPEKSVRGVPNLSSNIKLIFNFAGNCLINQHSDCNATAKMLADESLVEFIAVGEHFLTSSAKFADILLPGDHCLERDDISAPAGLNGDYAVFYNKAVDTVFECRHAYDWISDLADKLGLKKEFTEGKSLEDWLRLIVDSTRKTYPEFPSYEEFKAKGVYRFEYPEPIVAFKKQIDDPANNPFPTPSGKIEIFSPRLWAMNNPTEIPAVPKYVPTWEGPHDTLKEKFPLQCIGHHIKRRVHSTYDNTGWMEEAAPQEVWLNPSDAKERGINNGEKVKLYNDRGTMILPAKITPRIMPGVVSVPQGAWWSPDSGGIDRRGCINTITKYHPTPLAFGNPQHTNLVQVTKA